MLAAYLAILGRSIVTSLLAAAVVIVILFVSSDLDRPQQAGLITVPYRGPRQGREPAMDPPPAAGP